MEDYSHCDYQDLLFCCTANFLIINHYSKKLSFENRNFYFVHVMKYSSERFEKYKIITKYKSELELVFFG